MSRTGRPSSGIVTRSQLRPKRLSPTESRLATILRRRRRIDPAAIPDLLGCSERTGYYAAAALVRCGFAHADEGMLVLGRGPR